MNGQDKVLNMILQLRNFGPEIIFHELVKDKKQAKVIQRQIDEVADLLFIEYHKQEEDCY